MKKPFVTESYLISVFELASPIVQQRVRINTLIKELRCVNLTDNAGTRGWPWAVSPIYLVQRGRACSTLRQNTTNSASRLS